MKRILLTLLVLLTACAASNENEEPTSLTTGAPSTTASSTLTATTAATGGEASSVGVSDFSFSPSTLTVSVGDTVTWNLTDGSHTSTSGTPPDGDDLWSETLDPEAPFTFTFTEAGEFPYFCRFHPDFMTGVVIVEP